MNRILRHLLTNRWSLRRKFPPAALAAIESAIHGAEAGHGGEMRFAVETCLHWRHLQAGRSPQDRARDLFGRLRIWDTAQRNGVLIYLLLADHDIEIVADRGYDGKVTPEEWESVCRIMEKDFRAGHFAGGTLEGIKRVSALIVRHFPRQPGDRDELPDAPVVLD